MNDKVSDEDRVLIDEAVAQGRIRVIPYGVRAIRLDDMVYDDNLGRLRYADKELGRNKLKKSMKWGRGK